MPEFKDVEKQCKEQDCKKTFILTAGEQEFFESKGLHMPARCPDCRAKKKRMATSPFSPLRGKEFPGMGSEEPVGVGAEGQE